MLQLACTTLALGTIIAPKVRLVAYEEAL